MERKIDVEPVFGFLKANLSFNRFSVRGKSKVENEIGFALMAINLRKYTTSLQINDEKSFIGKIKKWIDTASSTESIHFLLIQTGFTPVSYIG